MCISASFFEGNNIDNAQFFTIIKTIKNKSKPRRHKMAYKITDTCVACGTCAGECPVGAISEGDIYQIDPDVCISCGTCAGVCPMGAIEEE